MNSLFKWFSGGSDEARLIEKAKQQASLNYGLGLSREAYAASLRAMRRPAEAVKIQIVPIVIAHCLTIELCRSAMTGNDLARFSNTMSDHTKGLLATSGIEPINPVEAFPDDDMRQAAIGTFFGPEVINSWQPIVTPDRLFSMMLVLETFILAKEMKETPEGFDGSMRLVRAHFERLSNVCVSGDGAHRRQMDDFFATIIAAAKSSIT